ncbi:MAG: FG-GAP-like repeat-containing protein [Planctomycetota bacterium]
MLSCVAALALGCTPAPPAASREELHHWRNLGELYFRGQSERLDNVPGDAAGFARAAEWLGKVAAASPDDVHDQLNHARALLFAGEANWTRAQAPLERARRLTGGQPDLPELTYLTALYFNRTGDTAAALAQLRRTIEILRPDRTRWFPQVWYQCVLAEEKARDYAAAERTCRELIDSCAATEPPPIDARFRRPALYRLSQILVAQGRRDEGKVVFQEFSRLEQDKTLNDEACELTEVTLERPHHADEPATVAWLWEEVSTAWLGEWSGLPLDRGRAMDIERDGTVELLVLGPGRIGLIQRNGPNLRTLEHAFASDLRNPATEAVTGDLDNDGDSDIVLLGAAPILLRCGAAEAQPRFEVVATPALPSVYGAQLVDADHEGHLDLVGLGGDGAFVFLRSRVEDELDFEAVRPIPAAASVTPGARIAAHDLDQANDLDLVLPAGPSRPALACLNLRDGTYATFPLPGFEEHPLLFAEDFDGDAAPDVLATGGLGGWSFARNADSAGTPYRLRMQPTISGPKAATGPVRDAKLADLDNDGDLDVVLATAGGVRILRNARGGNFVVEEGPPLGEGGATTVEVADLDGDRRLDLVIGTDAQRLRVFANRSDTYLGVLLVARGKADNRDAVGTVVEVFAGRRTRSARVRESYGHPIGTGERELDRFDGIRLRWPGGLKQAIPRAELALDEARRAFIDQVDGPFVSCPFLYTLTPDGWRFATDVIGIAPLGEWVPPGATGHLDSEEFVRIPADALACVEGKVRLAITEELRETAYLDRLELLVIDHPAGLELYLDESTRQAGPADPMRLLAIPRPALSALRRVSTGATDEGAQLTAARDGKYLHGYEAPRSQWAGWVPPFAVEMTTDRVTRALLLCGRIYWYDSARAYSRWLRGGTWPSPRLERVDASGHAQVLLPDLGLPAGMDRTLICEFPPVEPGTRLRITAQHQLLWDQMRAVEVLYPVEIAGARGTTTIPSGDDLHYHTAPVERATLAGRGVSRVIGNRERHEETYDFADAGPCWIFDRAVGVATRFGDVTDLTRAPDDRLVVLATGDCVEVEFAVPPMSEARTYFLKVTGWAKENGYHVQHGATIEPLPFHAMSQYPPRADETPTHAEYREYLDHYQTRVVK